MNRTKKHPQPLPRAAHPDDGEAFIPDRARHEGALADDAEADAEEFIAGATSGEAVFEDARDEFNTEELGGPFLEYDTTKKAAQDFLAANENANENDNESENETIDTSTKAEE